MTQGIKVCMTRCVKVAGQRSLTDLMLDLLVILHRHSKRIQEIPAATALKLQNPSVQEK